MTDRLDRLERLGRLRDQGLLTDEEFTREKALLLAGKEANSAPTADAATPASSEPAGGHTGQPDRTASDAAATPFVETPENAVANDLTSTLRPINGVPDASQQVGRVWATAALLIAGEFVSEVGRVNQSLAGRSWTSTVSMGDELLTSALSLSVSTVVVGLLSLWIARRASRVGVVILAVMTVSAVVWPFMSPEPMKLAAKLGSGGLAALALWYLIGVARGAFWLAGRRPVAGNPAPAEAPSWKDAWARGRATSAPTRKIIGWIALGWLGLFLIGGIWFWWSTRDNELAARPMVTPAANAPMPAAPNVATAAPGGELIPLQSPQAIVGVWVDEGGGCASDAAFELEEGGRLLAFGVQGSWLLSAGSLTMTTQEVDMDTEQPVGPAYEYTGVVQLVGPNEFHLTGNGPMRRYRRCNADGTEPW
ncbi:SHOCT domain-containing protein [Aquidulcibacter paucihalophilus]|jgi:hypothetical protein|nr:SHOCT domain-containing protein [Aquidulcibacter paucihalophilus]